MKKDAIVSSAPVRIRSRSTTWVASSEVPPSEKKSSSKPIRRAPSTCSNTVATASSSGVDGARKTACSNTGSGSARRSSFPTGVNGTSSSTTTAAGTMYPGRLRAASSVSAAGSIRRPAAAST